MCAGWAQAQGPLTQLHLTAWPRPALITEAGARAPQALVTAAVGGTVAGWGEGQAGWCWHMGQGGQGAGQGRAAQPTLAQGPKGSRGTELTGRAGEARVAAALPAAAHAVHARAALVTGAAGAARASSGRGEERGEVRPRQEPRTCTPSPRALENTWTPNPVHQVPYHLHRPPAQNTLSCRSTHPSLTTPSPLLCSQPSWGLGGPGSRVCSLGTLTSALAAVVTRAAAGLPGGGDAAAVAAPAQALGVSPGAGPGPHAAQGQGVQRRGRPELGEVAPAGLRAALGQEGSGCKPGACWALPSPAT